MTVSTQFIRDRFTWLAYLMLAFYAYMQAALGPLMPFVRQELQLSYTVAGLHLSAFALGMVISGLTGDRLARRYSRHFTLWLGAAGMALGGASLALSSQVLFTLSSTFLMGWLGSFVLVMVQATLSDRHANLRAIALTESNLAASISASMAPLVVGNLQRIGLGWQGALYLGGVAVALMALGFYRQPLPEVDTSPEGTTAASAPLPPAFWAYWSVVVLVVSAEWSVIFWGADFMETYVGLSKVNAATLMSVFFAAMIVGRFLGTRLTRSISGQRLLLLALLVTAVGFPIFWLAPVALLNILGLFVTGLGVANLFPLTLSVAVNVSPRQADRASARLSLGGGVAILTAPLFLGWIADQLGLNSAFALVLLFLALALGAAFTANRLASR